MINDFSNRLNKLFTLSTNIEKLCRYAEDEVYTWINKFINNKHLPKSALNNLEVLVRPNDIPDNESRDMFGRFQGEFRSGIYVRQLIINVGYCIINYQGKWKDIYTSLENFIGNVALHEVCHYVAFYNNVQNRSESMHGDTWKRYYNKYRSVYTKVPLEVSNNGLYTNFANKFDELWSNDFDVLKPYSTGDSNIFINGKCLMGDIKINIESRGYRNEK